MMLYKLQALCSLDNGAQDLDVILQDLHKQYNSHLRNRLSSSKLADNQIYPLETFQVELSLKSCMA